MYTQRNARGTTPCSIHIKIHVLTRVNTHMRFFSYLENRLTIMRTTVENSKKKNRSFRNNTKKGIVTVMSK